MQTLLTGFSAEAVEMPYVPPEVKERIKREVSIQRLAEARGIKLRRSGKELIGLCPFHDDRNPSLNIDPAKNMWSCKGACGEGGDVIRWVARTEGVSDGHAIALLKNDYAPSSGPVVKQSTVPKLPCPVTLGAEDRRVMLEVVKFYGDTLRETVEGVVLVSMVTMPRQSLQPCSTVGPLFWSRSMFHMVTVLPQLRRTLMIWPSTSLPRLVAKSGAKVPPVHSVK